MTLRQYAQKFNQDKTFIISSHLSHSVKIIDVASLFIQISHQKSSKQFSVIAFINSWTMGNSEVIDNNNIRTVTSRNATELVEMKVEAQQFAEEEYVQTQVCCGFEFKKKIKRKIYWQNNFISNCTLVKEEFRWASQLIDLITLNKQAKTLYFREVNSLKKEMASETEEYEREVLMSRAELEQFKLNIKKSVLISSSQTSKYFKDTPNKLMPSINHQARQSRIQISKFRNSIATKTPAKKLQRRSSVSSSKSGLRKSIMSFVDDTLSSVFGNEREISKKVAQDLQIFLKFSMMLEKHFNDPNCILFKIKKRFIEFITRNYGESVDITKIDELIDSINQFMIIMKEVLIDYYNLTSYAEDGPHSNNFITNEQNILSICNSIFFKDHHFYETIFAFIARYNQERQAKLKKILELLEHEEPSTFYIKDNFSLNFRTIKFALRDGDQPKDQAQYIIDDEPYRRCKLALNELQTSKTPVNKMKIILNVSEMMNKDIQRFYEVNGLERQKWMLDADQVLSIFCYIIVGSKISNIFTHLFILDHFSTSSQMISIFGYYLSVMNCAVEQLENDYLEKLQNEVFQ